MEVLQQLWEIFPYAVLGSILAGIVCSFLGVFVVSQRVVFLGAALTQASIAGVAFSFLHLVNIEAFFSSILGLQISDSSFLHNFEAVFFSMIFAIITVLIFSQTHRQKYFTQDGILGIVFVVAIAIRIMFIQKSPVAEVSEIESILKGDILFIGSSQFYTLLVIAVVVISIFLLFQKQFKFVVFDPESADAHGINSKFWLVLFYLIVGIGISLITRFVGDVFTFSYLIIPSTIGIMLGKTVFKVFSISIIMGALFPPLALILAFKFDFSSGPMAVAISFAVFVFVLGYKKIFNR
jgi:zinc transport system permease protein